MIFVAIILAIVGVILFLKTRGKMKVIGGAACAIAAALAVMSCVVSIPTGYTGIVTTFGRVEDRTLDAGLSFIAPWQAVVKMDNRVQEFSEDLMCFSSDIQEVSASVTVGYRINQNAAMNLYKEVGKNYKDIIILPKMREVVKTGLAKYTANDLIESRAQAVNEITETLATELSNYNIELDYISLINIDFTDTFTDAVEAKAKAEQDKERAQTEAEQKVIEAEAKAKEQQIAADTELYAAQKAAEANQALTSSITPELIEYYRIMDVDSKWNGELPSYVGGGETIPVLNNIE